MRSTKYFAKLVDARYGLFQCPMREKNIWCVRRCWTRGKLTRVPNTLISRIDYLQTTIFESRAGILYSVETELLEGL
jgi:hypothetical protein